MLMAAASAGIRPITLTGSMNGSGSTATVAGGSAAVSWIGANSGKVKFQNLSIGATGTMKYSNNGGAFTTITNGLEITLVNGGTLQVEATGLTSPETDTVDIVDSSTGTTIKTGVSIART